MMAHPKLEQLAGELALEPFDLLASHLEGAVGIALCSRLECTGRCEGHPHHVDVATCPECGQRSLLPLDRIASMLG